MKLEIWRDYIYNYQISNFGNIKNKINNTQLKTRIGSTGYLGCVVSLGSRNKKKLIKIHRAVAETFISNFKNYPIVNHIDGNKLNNHISNLEWCTHSENIKHAYSHKLNTPRYKKIYCNELKMEFKSIKDLSIYLTKNNLVKTKNWNNAYRSISRVLRNERKSYRKLTFKFI